MTNPTPEQIEAAAKVIDPNAFARLSVELDAAERESLEMTQATLQRLAREQARAALVAAAGAAPRSEVHEPSHDRVYCVRCGGNWPCAATAVQVDEAKLVKMVRDTIDRRPYTDETRTAIHGLENAIGREIWRRLDEWLRGGGR